MMLIRLILICSLLVGTFSNAAAEDNGDTLASTAPSPIYVNDANQLAESSFKLSGKDDYFVFKREEIINNNGLLIFPVVIEAPKSKQGKVSLQLFFAGNSASDSTQFDPFSRIGFSVQAQQLDGIKPLNLRINDGIAQTLSAIVRLDIEGCKECLVNFVAIDKLAESSIDTETMFIRNGRLELADTHGLLSRSWHFHDIDNNGAINSNDPYISSPFIDINTENLAGVYFELKLLNEIKLGQAQRLFQLFYATEAHGFIENASSLIKAELKTTEHGEKLVQFFAPLDFLSRQIPKRELLERLRLDFQANDDIWQVQNIVAVADNSLHQYAQFKPNSISQKKIQKAAGPELARGSIQRIVSDKGFLFFYLIILITCIALIRRGIKA